jgi:hypothetical protein
LTPGVTYEFYVTARNTVGSSLQSDNLAVLAAKLPDAPINLANVPGDTTAYQIGITWEEGPYNGGSPVIDYKVSFKEINAASYSVFSDGQTTTSAIVTSLTPGLTYRIVVQSRNVVDYS